MDFHFEYSLRSKTRSYRKGHNADAIQFIDDHIPIIHIVSKEEIMRSYILVSHDEIYGNQAPILTRPMWTDLNQIMFVAERNFLISGGTTRLSLKQILIDAANNPSDYGLGAISAIILMDAFGLATDGSIRRSMQNWWTIYDRSNDPTYCRMFMQQRNML